MALKLFLLSFLLCAVQSKFFLVETDKKHGIDYSNNGMYLLANWCCLTDSKIADMQEAVG